MMLNWERNKRLNTLLGIDTCKEGGEMVCPIAFDDDFSPKGYWGKYQLLSWVKEQNIIFIEEFMVKIDSMTKQLKRHGCIGAPSCTGLAYMLATPSQVAQAVDETSKKYKDLYE